MWGAGRAVASCPRVVALWEPGPRSFSGIPPELAGPGLVAAAKAPFPWGRAGWREHGPLAGSRCLPSRPLWVAEGTLL